MLLKCLSKCSLQWLENNKMKVTQKTYTIKHKRVILSEFFMTQSYVDDINYH